MRLFVYPPTAVSVTVPPVAYTDGGVNTPVTPSTPLPVTGEFGSSRFVRDGSLEEVAEDTATPANNRPFPSGLYFYKNGLMVPVTDSSTPSEVAAIPVTIKATDGTNITITAGDINIQTTSEGPTFDSQRIGNGSGVYLKIENDGSINVVGIADVISQLSTLNGVDFATGEKQDLAITAIGLLLTELEKKADLTETQPVSVSGLPLPTGAATEAKQADVISQLSTLNGVDFATGEKQDTGNLSLSNIDGKLPATLGQKPSANSLAIVPSSDYIPPASAVPIALTVQNKAVSFGTGATRLTCDGGSPSPTRRKLQFIIEPTPADVNYFMGASGVQNAGADRGIRLYPGTLYTYENDAADYHIISDAATQTVFIMEQE